MGNKNLQLLLEALKQYHLSAETIKYFEDKVNDSETIEEELLQFIKDTRLRIKEDLKSD